MALTLTIHLPPDLKGKQEVILMFRFIQQKLVSAHTTAAYKFGDTFVGIINLINPQVYGAEVLPTSMVSSSPQTFEYRSDQKVEKK